MRMPMMLGILAHQLKMSFISPRSSPTPLSPMEGGAEAASQEVLKPPVAPKERFFTPRAPTPEFLRKMVNIAFDFKGILGCYTCITVTD